MGATTLAVTGLQNCIPTKIDIINYSNALINDVNSGWYSALDTLIEIKKMQKCFELVEKAIKDQARIEGAEHNKQLHKECLIEVVPTNVTYDYDICNDSVYNNLLEQEKSIKAMIKNRQELLKIGVSPETGETFQKAEKKYIETIKITIK